MNDIDIPRYVDAQLQLFFWELDETIVFVAALAGGIVLGGWMAILGIIGGVFAVKSFRRFKNGSLDGILQHMTYWAGMFELNAHYPDAAQTEYFL